MEHSAQYERIMNERAERARKREDNMHKFVRGFGVGFLGLVAVLGLIYGLIKLDHNRAVRKYNENNWVIVNEDNGVTSVQGMAEGEPFSYVDNGTYYGGISVEGVELKGMDYTQARAAVMKVIEDKLNTISMVITVGDASLTLPARDFNISVNANEVLDAAYSLGRESLNDPTANYLKQKSLLENPVDYKLRYTCDRNRIEQRVADIAEFVNTEPVEPYVTVSQKPSANADTVEAGDDSPLIKDTDTIVETVCADNGKAIGYIYYNPGKEGFVLDQETMVNRILEAFDEGDYDCNLSAELERTAPEKTPSDIKGSVRQITSYTTEFDHDEKHMNRCRNVQKAAGILNGCVVKPGQE
ncbi:MAG: peptidoglycan binding domain-containing protein, partial [Clostridia bacterium]|nr:peptidoglycan binding domain-containing protein [Clostridia bacterium]